MVSPSAALRVSTDGGVTWSAPNPPSVKVAAHSQLLVRLDSTSGVGTVAWSVTSTDETSDVTNYNPTVSGSRNGTCTLTTLGVGTGAILRAFINNGRVGGVLNARTRAQCTGEIKFYVGVVEVGAFGEQMQGDRKFGTLRIINGPARSLGLLAAPDYQPTPSTVPLRGTSGDLLSVWVAPASTGVAASGFLRVKKDAQTVVAALNAAGTHDVSLLAIDGSDGVIVGGQYAASLTYQAPIHTFKDASGAPLLAVDEGNNRVELDLDTLRWLDSASPAITQKQAATGSANGTDMLIVAQSGGPGGAGTLGGSLILAGGFQAGGAGLKWPGNVVIGDLDTATPQDGHGGRCLIIAGHGVQEPTANIAASWQINVAAAGTDLKFRSPNGNTVKLPDSPATIMGSRTDGTALLGLLGWLQTLGILADSSSA